MTHKTTLMDVMNTAGQTVGIALDTLNDYNMEVASAELMQQQIKTAKWQQDEMLKFQGRTDFENFEQEYNDDFNDLYGSYNGKSGDSFYRSRYSQKAGNEYLSKLKLEGDSKVKQMVWQGQRDYQTQCYTSAIETLRTQPVSQERLDAEKEIYDTMRSQNLIDPNAYFTGIQNTLTAGLYDEIQQEAASWVAAHPNASDQDLDEYLASFTSTLDLTYQDADGSIKSMGIDRDSVKEKARSSYLQGLNRTRSGNNLEISRTNDQLIKDAMTGNGNTTAIRAQQAKIWSLGNMDLTTDDRMTRWTELQRILDALEGAEAAGSGSAGGSQREAAGTELTYAYCYNYLNKQGAERTLDKDMLTAFSGKKDGNTVYGTMLATESKFLDWLNEDPVWRSADDTTKDVIWGQLLNTYFTGSNGALTKALEGNKYSQPLIDEITGAINAMPKISPQQKQDCLQFICDMAFNTNLYFETEQERKDFIDSKKQEYFDNYVTTGFTLNSGKVNAQGETEYEYRTAKDKDGKSYEKVMPMAPKRQESFQDATAANFDDQNILDVLKNLGRPAERTLGPDRQYGASGNIEESDQPLRLITAPGYGEASSKMMELLSQDLRDQLGLKGNVQVYPCPEKDENGEYTGNYLFTITGTGAGDWNGRQVKYYADKGEGYMRWRDVGPDMKPWDRVPESQKVKRENHDNLMNSYSISAEEEARRNYESSRNAIPDFDTWSDRDDDNAQNEIVVLAQNKESVKGMSDSQIREYNSIKGRNEQDTQQKREQYLDNFIKTYYGSYKWWKMGTPYGNK